MIIRYNTERMNDLADQLELMIKRLNNNAEIMKALSSGIVDRDGDIIKKDIDHLCSLARAANTYCTVFKEAAHRYSENELRTDSCNYL